MSIRIEEVRKLIDDAIVKHLEVDHFGEWNPEMDKEPPKPVSLQEYRRRKGRGKWLERELVQYLIGLGYNARRSALSGVGRTYPDVEAAKGGVYLAFEVKSSNIDQKSVPRIFVKGQQLRKVKEALDFFTPLAPKEVVGAVAVKFTQERKTSPWIFHRLTEEDFKAEFLKFTPDTPSNWNP